MTYQPFSDEVFKSLCEELRKLELPPEERQLLNAILKITWDVTGPSGAPGKDFDPRFDGCFESGQAALIREYLEAQPKTKKTVTKSFDGATVTRSITGGTPPPTAPAPAHRSHDRGR